MLSAVKKNGKFILQQVVAMNLRPHSATSPTRHIFLQT